MSEILELSALMSTYNLLKIHEKSRMSQQRNQRYKELSGTFRTEKYNK